MFIFNVIKDNQSSELVVTNAGTGCRLLTFDHRTLICSYAMKLWKLKHVLIIRKILQKIYSYWITVTNAVADASSRPHCSENFTLKHDVLQKWLSSVKSLVYSTIKISNLKINKLLHLLRPQCYVPSGIFLYRHPRRISSQLRNRSS